MRALVALSLLALAGCSSPSGAACPNGSTATWDNFGKDFTLAYCQRCHATNVTGAARKGATPDVNFDTVEGVRAHAAAMDEYAGAGPNGVKTFMPPDDPKPDAAERQKLSQWLACGAP
jgi:uncharacterized membrane protein